MPGDETPGQAGVAISLWRRWDPRGSLESDLIGRVFAEQVAVADVAAHGGKAAMAGLLHDGAFGFAGRGGGSGQPGAQAAKDRRGALCPGRMYLMLP